MLPAINVPQEVLERLKEDEEKRLEAGNEVMLSRGHSSNRNGEEILFWEPPLFARGFFNLENFILVVVICYGTALLPGFLVIPNEGAIVGSLVMLSVFIISFLIIFFIQGKWNMFSHRVVSSHRASLVITKSYSIFFSPGVSSVYFQTAMKNIEENKSKVRKVASVEYGNRGREGDDGCMIIHGVKDSLLFDRIQHMSLLEDAISTGINNTTTMKAKYVLKKKVTHDNNHSVIMALLTVLMLGILGGAGYGSYVMATRRIQIKVKRTIE